MANTRRRVTLSEIPFVHQESVHHSPNVLTPTLIDSPMNNIQIPLSYLSPQLSPDEQIIAARGRRSIVWSPHHDHPLKSPLKTPTKKLATMQLRSSPRKRLMSDFNDVNTQQNPGHSTPEKQIQRGLNGKCSNSTSKKIRFDDIGATSRLNPDIPFSKLLTGLSSDQLIQIILDSVKHEPLLEEKIRQNLPAPDLKPLEERLNILKRNIIKSLPKTRLLSKTDSAAYSRALTHVTAFKKCIFDQSKVLAESNHWDALLDYVSMAWTYVKGTPVWDNPSHNSSRRLCFKQLILQASNALDNGGVYLGEKRLKDFDSRLKAMTLDCEDAHQCHDQIQKLLQKCFVN
uniref:CSON013716 protein n=1 Tax=Culicoides sonorensis TaxID=179676 RepID=A0A336KZ93_CULSO